MENCKIQHEITVYCIQAISFPDGVKKAHEKLHSLVPFSSDRNYYGISFPNEKGEIIYKAAMTELKEGELSAHDLAKFIIPKGEYVCEIIRDFMKDVSAIGNTFQKMIQHPNIDPKGFCLEWYVSDSDVRCMVKLK